jgi:hypothetical protein
MTRKQITARCEAAVERRGCARHHRPREYADEPLAETAIEGEAIVAAA